MKRNLAFTSLLLFGLSALGLILLTLFESALVGIPLQAERIVTFLLLVLPPGTGAVLGVMSLVRKEGQPWPAIIGIVLNTLFACINLMILFFAG